MPPDSLPTDSLRSSATPRPDPAETARALIAWRLRRDAMLGSAATLFADPAWNILLDLYAEEAAGRRVSVSSACIAAGVPPTTALRWIARLEDAELIARTADPRDGRRAFLTLTAATRARMDRALAGAPAV